MCKCTGLALKNVKRISCGENYGQLQVLAFVDTDNWTNSSNTALTKANAAKRSTWVAFLEANESTSTPEMVITPMLYNPENDTGEPITWGGGNATPNGKSIVIGESETSFAAELRFAHQEQADAMKELNCLAEAGRLGMYLFDNKNNVIGKGVGTDLNPIPVASVYVGPKKFGGEEEPDYHPLSIKASAGWDEGLTYVTLNKITGSETTDVYWNGADLITVSLT